MVSTYNDTFFSDPAVVAAFTSGCRGCEAADKNMTAAALKTC